MPEDGRGGTEKPNTPLYNYTEQMVNNITALDPKFDKEVEEFKEAYMRNKSVYEEISKKAGVPPELIGIIHYRESTSDFINGKFNVYLHNGEALGAKTTLNFVGKDFNNFVDTDVDAIHDKQNYVEKYNLTSDSKDEVAIMVFAELYNGLGYYNNGHVSPYLYSGTNIYTSGKYIEEFINGKPVGVYNPQIVDKQIGAYLLLESLK
ncbi:lysozyme family protein [Kineothrix alysoides]|uniref:Lysozyme family protein n=1 Tax=Kineothrix alysoides TaxID=1469948 RepID=A0A4R1R6R8_9FIRM|nr:hypothetical protein [Kineothrix alysoides]TCL61002.1 lysozyme family protein [Kineothrix alysoides]